MKAQILYMGVDVSKRKLDYFIPARNHGRAPLTGQVPNDRGGVGTIRDLARKHGATVCCEPTGGYEDLLVEGMLEFGVPIVFTEGRRVRCFAEALGEISKNDKIDARMIVRFAVSVGPRQLTKRDEISRNIRDLWRLRSVIIRSRIKIEAPLERHPGHVESRWLRSEAGRLREKEQELLNRCVALAGSTPETRTLYERFLLVGGIGPATAVAVLAEFPEIGDFTPSAAAKMAGLAPAEWSSGSIEHKKHIRGGRGSLRCSLYMAAVASLSGNRILRAFYDRKTSEGHPPKWVLVAVMRKLLNVLSRIARDPKFVPQEDSRKRGPRGAA